MSGYAGNNKRGIEAMFDNSPSIASAKFENGVLELLSAQIEGLGAVKYQYTERHRIAFLDPVDFDRLKRLADGFADREHARAEYVANGKETEEKHYERISPLEEPMASWVDQRKERIFFPARYREVNS